MLLADFGTSYCKILDTESGQPPRIVATRDLEPDFCADLATGHNAGRRSRQVHRPVRQNTVGGTA